VRRGEAKSFGFFRRVPVVLPTIGLPILPILRLSVELLASMEMALVWVGVVIRVVGVVVDVGVVRLLFFGEPIIRLLLLLLVVVLWCDGLFSFMEEEEPISIPPLSLPINIGLSILIMMLYDR